MSTFTYSPSIKVRIATAQTTYDVSADISAAQITRVINGVSSMSLTLTNTSRKYDGIFSPMDRLVIYLRRIGQPILVFSGYLDSSPVFSTHPGSIRLRGSCTLKRLQHFMWDPGTAAAVNLMAQDNPTSVSGNDDGGISKRIINILHEVASWPEQQIHIAGVPPQWFKVINRIAAKMIKDAQIAGMIQAVTGSGYLSGKTTFPSGGLVVPGVGPGTGRMPNAMGTVGVFGGSGGASGKMSLTGEPRRLSDGSRGQWGGSYYIQMRFPYQVPVGGTVKLVDGANKGQAEHWWRNRRILVVNPKNGKAVCVRCVDWGPQQKVYATGQGQKDNPSAASGTEFNVSQAALKAMGAKTGDTVYTAFAPDGTTLGPQKSQVEPLPAGIKAFDSTGTGTTTSKAEVDQMAALPKRSYGWPIAATFAQLQAFLQEAKDQGYVPRENPKWGGVTPGVHLSNAEGGWHYWPPPNGGGAADITWPGSDFHSHLDSLAAAAVKAGLGCLWWRRGHYDHVHVDIGAGRDIHSGPASGAKNAPALGSSPGDPGAGTDSGLGDSDATGGQDNIGEALLAAFQWIGQVNPGSNILGGERALMNDVPLFSTVDQLFKAGLRHWCSAPNGDIIGWFPDYFGHWGTAGRMVIQPIEILEGFAVQWSDDRLKTHMFVTGNQTDTTGIGAPDSQATELWAMSGTAGIASVEMPDLMSALLNVDPDLFADKGKAFLNRFGARPEFEAMDEIHGPKQEFFFAVYKFMQNWSQQYSANIQLTFMPEVFPGMILMFPSLGVQAYVQEVTHTIGMNNSDGFRTNVSLIAWSSIEGLKTIRGLPKGGKM